ncbi:MAG: hypothetical protein ACI81P_002850 [Neolewinella sp.]|jgi:hypothetical protein
MIDRYSDVHPKTFDKRHNANQLFWRYCDVIIKHHK